jgi:GTP cyclohydrolase I
MNYSETRTNNICNPQFDREKIMDSVKSFLSAIGRNVDEPGLKGTPDRVARMVEEVLEGELYTNEEIAKTFSTCFDYKGDGLVTELHIPIFSYCEHHLALMYDMKVSVAYIPNGKVIGLSKIARIADMAAKRLQLQERIGNDIAEILQMVTGSEDVAVFIEASHSCMTARGIKNASAKTHTQTLRGRFKTDSALLQRLK